MCEFNEAQMNNLSLEELTRLAPHDNPWVIAIINKITDAGEDAELELEGPREDVSDVQRCAVTAKEQLVRIREHMSNLFDASRDLLNSIQSINPGFASSEESQALENLIVNPLHDEETELDELFEQIGELG